MPLLPFSPASPYMRREDVELERHQAAQLAPPPIGLTGVMCEESSLDVSRTLSDGTLLNCTIRYRVFRPRQLRDADKPPPLVVLHGGPSVPSNYLIPLVHWIHDRALVFYDQVGCGRSSRPCDVSAYSIDASVEDFKLLLERLNLKEFHLYGHSFGGILAFEYLKNNDNKCLSLVLSSAPTSIALVQEESKRLLETVKEELLTNDEDASSRQCLEVFRQTHECRVVPIPLPLLDAYAQAGSVWRGIEAIPDYVAEQQQQQQLDTAMPPALVLRGQFDFVTQSCLDGWKEMLPSSTTVVLSGCSHYGMLENEELYGNVIDSFLVDHDPKQEEEGEEEQQEEAISDKEEHQEQATSDEDEEQQEGTDSDEERQEVADSASVSQSP